MAPQPVARPDRPAHQFAAAIGTMPAEHSFGALAAKRALIRADPRVERMGRQIPVAAFAIGPQFQHSGAILMCRCVRILRVKVGIGERLSL
jgi:hypothetical protein